MNFECKRVTHLQEDGKIITTYNVWDTDTKSLQDVSITGLTKEDLQGLIFFLEGTLARLG